MPVFKLQARAVTLLMLGVDVPAHGRGPGRWCGCLPCNRIYTIRYHPSALVVSNHECSGACAMVQCGMRRRTVSKSPVSSARGVTCIRDEISLQIETRAFVTVVMRGCFQVRPSPVHRCVHSTCQVPSHDVGSCAVSADPVHKQHWDVSGEHTI